MASRDGPFPRAHRRTAPGDPRLGAPDGRGVALRRAVGHTGCGPSLEGPARRQAVR
jgi:hypothetical protein